MLAQLSYPWWVFVILGVAAGVVSSSLGLGAGTVVVPGLVLICHFGQKSAQGMALAIIVPTALVGALQYWRYGIEMDWLAIVLIICGALVGTVGGMELAARLPASVLRKAFALMLVVIAVKMFTMSPKASGQAIEGEGANQNTANSIGNGDVSDVTRKQ
ncbi:MAG TPA: sulfite exporter TauE/SafE family protein [Sedimentisphaerales bacterium]|nr:sulfite exporter TauE/SafE family protein [Sedimentisphaerales bacterium]